MIGQFIVVKRAPNLHDLGVFTGRMMLVESTTRHLGFQPMVMGDADISPHIEHAFVFPTSNQAWKWVERMLPDEEGYRRGVNFLTWDVREFGDFALGEHRVWGRIARPHFVRLTEEVAAEAFQEGVREGYRRAYEVAAA